MTSEWTGPITFLNFFFIHVAGRSLQTIIRCGVAFLRKWALIWISLVLKMHWGECDHFMHGQILKFNGNMNHGNGVTPIEIFTTWYIESKVNTVVHVSSCEWFKSCSCIKIAHAHDIELKTSHHEIILVIELSMIVPMVYRSREARRQIMMLLPESKQQDYMRPPSDERIHEAFRIWCALAW